MTRIYAVTLNPALDLSGHVAHLVTNEKNTVFDSRKDPGGNSINAGRIASRLGAHVKHFGFVGGGVGQELSQLLRKEGQSLAFTPIREATRVNVTVTNESDHRQTRLSFEGPRISPAEKSRFFSAIAAQKPGIVLIGGSLPHGFTTRDLLRLVRMSRKRGHRVTLDVPASVGREVFKSVSHLGLEFIKPNVTELEWIVGKKLRTETAIFGAAQRLSRHTKWVCVSLGSKGALLVGRDGRCWRGRPVKVRARGTVGAGDSMLGAMVTHLSESPKTFLRWGLAAGAATASTRGTSLGKKSAIQKLFQKAKTRQLPQ